MMDNQILVGAAKKTPAMAGHWTSPYLNKYIMVEEDEVMAFKIQRKDNKLAQIINLPIIRKIHLVCHYWIIS